MTPPADVSCITITETADALVKTHSWLQAFTEDNALSVSLQHDLQLIAEELLINGLQYGSSQTLAITICVWLNDHCIWLQFRQCGNRFNPLITRAPDLSAGVNNRPIGGLGIHLVKKLSDHIHYNYQNGVNHLQIGLKKSSH